MAYDLYLSIIAAAQYGVIDPHRSTKRSHDCPIRWSESRARRGTTKNVRTKALCSGGGSCVIVDSRISRSIK